MKKPTLIVCKISHPWNCVQPCVHCNRKVTIGHYPPNCTVCIDLKDPNTKKAMKKPKKCICSGNVSGSNPSCLIHHKLEDMDFLSAAEAMGYLKKEHPQKKPKNLMDKDAHWRGTVDIAMGVSEWRAHGTRYSYDKFFKIKWPKHSK